MKKIILLIAFLTISCNSFSKTEMTKDSAIEGICGEMNDYAQSVMRSRQLGNSIVNNIKAVNNANMPKHIADYRKSIIYEAYKEPKFSTKENQDNAVNEFGNTVYLSCVQAFQKQLSDIE